MGHITGCDVKDTTLEPLSTLNPKLGAAANTFLPAFFTPLTVPCNKKNTRAVLRAGQTRFATQILDSQSRFATHFRAGQNCFATHVRVEQKRFATHFGAGQFVLPHGSGPHKTILLRIFGLDSTILLHIIGLDKCLFPRIFGLDKCLFPRIFGLHESVLPHSSGPPKAILPHFRISNWTEPLCHTFSGWTKARFSTHFRVARNPFATQSHSAGPRKTMLPHSFGLDTCFATHRRPSPKGLGFIVPLK